MAGWRNSTGRIGLFEGANPAEQRTSQNSNRLPAAACRKRSPKCWARVMAAWGPVQWGDAHQFDLEILKRRDGVLDLLRRVKHEVGAPQDGMQVVDAERFPHVIQDVEHPAVGASQDQNRAGGCFQQQVGIFGDGVGHQLFALGQHQLAVSGVFSGWRAYPVRK